MREVLEQLMPWWEAGETVGMGTVVATFRSAPRPAGASMLVGPDGSAVGSVSGGCVEGAVYDLAQTVVGSGEPLASRFAPKSTTGTGASLPLRFWIRTPNCALTKPSRGARTQPSSLAFELKLPSGVTEIR